MRRITLLTMCAPLMVAMMMASNCSNPLDTTDPAKFNPPDPITIYDTVEVTDTLTRVDTVVVTEPGTGEPQAVCSILLSNLYEIIWMFHNQEGDYLLEFTADAARDYDFRTLTVEIDGERFEWKVGETQEFSVEAYLSASATIRIMTDQPCLQGHEVEICLTMSML